MDIQISKDNALKAYQQADESGKKLLVGLFGGDTFNFSVTDRVKTFKDACKELSINPDDYLQVQLITGMDPADTRSIQAYAKLTIVIRALNEGWIPDWNNDDKYKYYPWFEMDASGSGLVFDNYGDWDTGAGAGSRLCFKSSDLAKYAGETFKDLYNDFLKL